MGEGRRDRSSRRHRANLGIEKSSSDTEVGRSNAKSRKNRAKKKREKWPFLEGLTVDELGRYRRRRVENQPRDTLGAHCQSSDSKDETPVTEYRRAFRAISEDSILSVLKSPLTRIAADEPSEPKKITAPSVVESVPNATVVTEQPLTPVEKPSTHEQGTAMEIALDRPSQQQQQQQQQQQHHEGTATNNVSTARPPLMRRGTSLRREGDEFYGNTEYSSYVSHEGNHRAELARRPTSLKMEGNMAGAHSEQCDKFIEWLNVTRPELARIPTNLKLEGDIERLTENHDKYVPFVGARRPELLRQTAHLKLEGESNFLPEYTDVFREHHVRRGEKRVPHLPESHLKTGGNFCEKTESSEAYGEPGIDTEVAAGDRRRGGEENASAGEKERRQKGDQDMRILVSKLEDLNGGSVAITTPLQVPEYKDAYKDFPRERPRLMKPEDEIGRADGSKVHSSAAHGRFQTKIDQDLEYRSKFLDRDRATVYGKPPAPMFSRRPSVAAASSAAFDGRASREYHQPRHHQTEATSEVRSQYVPYGHIPRVEILKMPANLRLEGNIDLHPEYRDAYCTKRADYAATLREPRAHRHRRDRSLSGSRRRAESNGGCWTNNNNSEHFGQINAADDQDAFQLLSTKVHEESIVGKPPPGSRRASHLDIASPTGGHGASMRNRSPSPSYRLQVHNVDDKPRGFARRSRRSPSIHFGDPERRIQSPVSPSCPDHYDHHHHHQQQETSQRPYSPSFGTTQQHRNANVDEHAFVVLDNTGNHNAPFNKTVVANRSRKLLDRNCNNIVAKRSRTPTNWMPPWYDNTNTI